jgi:acyl carrier protein
MSDQSTVVEGRSEEEVRSYVAEIVLELATNQDELPAEPGSRLVDDLGFHSLALLELAFTLEDEFDLPPIDETTAREITTVGSVAAHVIANLRSRGALAE